MITKLKTKKRKRPSRLLRCEQRLDMLEAAIHTNAKIRKAWQQEVIRKK